MGYRIDALPKPQRIFELVKEAGGVEDAEMYRVFNMGIGFVVIVEERDEKATLDAIEAAGYAGGRIGTVTENAGKVVLESVGLVGTLDGGESSFTPI